MQVKELLHDTINSVYEVCRMGILQQRESKPFLAQVFD